MKYKRIKIFTIILSIILICIVLICINFIIIVNNATCKDKVGIIDTILSTKYEGITYSDNTYFNSNEKTHGDDLISFVYDYQKKVDLYYYDATNEYGEINTTNIIKALEWMISNNVKRVNISYSNTIKHKDLESWIAKHDEIDVYASYNNMLNSFDYPAMYESVYASGSDPRIHYKNIDFKYRNNRIIILTNNVFKIYHGNSFLSVLSMLKN